MKGLFLFFFALAILTLQAQKNTSTDQVMPALPFPEGTVWINCDYPMQIESYSNKILVLVFNDLLSIEGGYMVHQLTSKYRNYPQIQFVEVVSGNQQLQLSRRQVVQYAHRNNWSHPIAVVPHTQGFSEVITQIPSASVYYLDQGRTLFAQGLTELQKVNELLDDYCSDVETMRNIPNYSTIPEIQYTWFADPIVENPHRITSATSGRFYMIDQSHNRILLCDEFGNATQFIGSTAIGAQNGHITEASFNHPQGLVFHKDHLFVADTYNNSIRKISQETSTVETIWGTGELFKETVTKATKSIRQIGLPSAITVWDNQIIVASAQTNQLFSMHPESGSASLLFDLENKLYRQMNTTPVDLFAGEKLLYIVMSNGTLFTLNKKNELNAIPASTPFITSVCEIDGVAFATTRQNQILRLTETNQWQAHAGSVQAGCANGKLFEAQFNWPQDICEVNGDLIVADCDNHQIRLVPTSPKGVAKQITLIPTRELIQEKAANSEGELVVLDSVFVGRGTTEITIHLNTQNCSLVPGGVNELHIVPMPGFSIVQEEIKENFIKFKLDNRFQSEEANLEVYLTLEDPALPGVYLAKRTYLNVPIGRDKTIPLQELVYDLHIWPY